MIFSKNKAISLRKAQHVLRIGVARFARRRRRYNEAILDDLRDLRDAIGEKNRAKATEAVERLEASPLFHRTTFQFIVDLVVGLAVAVVFATVVRQVWFEPMVIPSGSMRPTFQEGDKLVVAKDSFGLNVPMQPAHFLFRPDLVKRTGVFIFTSEDMDIPNQDILYFIFPGKRRLIKRCMGLSGDRIYFYGGQVYWIDREGKEVEGLFDTPWMERLDYIPFMTFEGQMEGSRYNLVLRHMNLPVAKLQLLPTGKLVGEALGEADLSELWGMGNYAMARLQNGALELSHSPSVEKIAIGPTPQGVRPHLVLETSRIRLGEEGMQRLASLLYTSRFVVREGRAYPEMEGDLPPLSLRPALRGVPNGRYQFYHGIAYKVLWGGILRELPKDDPLYNPALVETLFNMGMEMVTVAAIQPRRYAYYRNGDLYLMGGLFLEKGSAFLEDLSFVDQGPPSRETIEKFGLKIPEKHYLALGDNYAGSGDSRIFGFVPEENLRGTPSFIFWPPGTRWGPPAQTPYPWITLPRLIVWAVAIIAFLLTMWWRRWRMGRLLG